jgi:ATP-binding cassette subfamily B protein
MDKTHTSNWKPSSHDHQAIQNANQYTSKQLLAVFWPYLEPHRARIALAIFALLLVAGALLGMGRGLAFLVDEGLGKDDPALLDRAVMVTVMIAAVLAFGSYLRASMVNKIGEIVMADVRRAIFGQVITLSASWFENAPTGDVLSRINTDTSIVQTVMTSTLSMAARNFLLLVGGLVMVVQSSPKMSLVVLVVVPLVVVPLIFMGRRLKDASRLAQDRLSDVGVEAEETIVAIRTVQAFSRETYVKVHFDGAVKQALDAGLARVRLRGLLSGIVIFFSFQRYWRDFVDRRTGSNGWTD